MNDVVIPNEIWVRDIAWQAESSLDWLWQGFIARGNATLHTSQWKPGKTTLLSLLLSRRVQGGTLGGLEVKPGKSVIVTRGTRFGLGRARPSSAIH